MAAPSYTEDLTDISLMESGETGAAALNISGGGGGAPAFGADFGMQGAGCWDKAASNAERAILTNNAPGAGVVAAGAHVFQWGFVATPGVLDTLVNRGVYVIAGTDASNYVQYHVDGFDTLGAQGRVGKCFVYRYTTTQQLDRVPYVTVTGTPGATPDEFGYGIKTLATVKGSNFGQDAHRYGTGAYLTAGELVSAGDASDDPCTFVGFNVQNDANSNRWGILTAVGPGSYELQGKFAMGQNNTPTATLVRFRDSDKNITVVDTVHSESDFTEFIFDHASSRIEWNNINVTAAGGWNKGDITVTANDPDVFFTGGTFTGLGVSTLQVSTTADGTTWRACGEVTANGATLANSTIIHGASIIDAQDETSYGDSPTSEGTFSGGTGHAATDILVLDDDTVIVVDAVSGGVVTQFTVDATRSKVFSGVRTQVASDGAGIDFTLTPDTDNYTESSGLIWNTAADPNGELDDMIFDTLTSEMGHAIEFGLTSPLTMTLTDIDFGTNYSNTADGSVGNETFNFLRTTGTVTLNLIGCTGNFGYQSAGAIISIVESPITIALNAKNQQGENVEGARVQIESAELTGDLPYMASISITRSGSTASVSHTGHGMANGDVVVIRHADQTEYTGNKTISNVSTNAYDFTVSGTPTTPATSSLDVLINEQDETDYDGLGGNGAFDGGHSHVAGDVISFAQLGIQARIDAASNVVMIDSQGDPNYDGVSGNGTFDGGTGHAVSDDITLSNGVLITVDLVSSGEVTEFSLDASGQTGTVELGDTITQSSTTGSGTDFSLTLGINNLTGGVTSQFTVLSGEQTSSAVAAIEYIQTDTTGFGYNFGVTPESPNIDADFIGASQLLITGLTDALGDISVTRTLSVDQNMKGWVRKSTSSPLYKQTPVSFTADATIGNTINVLLLDDE